MNGAGSMPVYILRSGMQERQDMKKDAEPFVQATIDTLRIMVKLDVRRGEIEAQDAGKIKTDISGMIGLSGETEGTVTLGLSRPLALAIAQAFLGKEDVSENMVADTVGELVNIISGFAKKDMADREVKISLPTVVVGNGHVIAGFRDEIRIVTNFETPLGAFHLSVHLENLPPILGLQAKGH